jgi:ABC-type multidrug transport system ATPase subunit
MNALTLEAFDGTCSGSVTFNGKPLTNQLLKEQAYVIKQGDTHCPYLTCRETLLYEAMLYGIVKSKNMIDRIVDQVIGKMSLDLCAEKNCGHLTVGEHRRLSIGIALLKQSTLLFLEKPTTGEIKNSSLDCIALVD